MRRGSSLARAVAWVRNPLPDPAAVRVAVHHSELHSETSRNGASGMIPKSLLNTLSAHCKARKAPNSSDEVPADARVLLSEIADLAGFSPKDRFFQDAWEAITLANRTHEIQHSPTSQRQSRRELSRLDKAGRKYADALKGCSGRTAFLLSIARPPLRAIVMPDLSHFADVVAEISSATSDAINVQVERSHYTAFRQLVFALLDAVKSGGGDLSLDDDSRTGLVSALDKLRDAQSDGTPLLSSHLMPKFLPISELRQLKAQWKKSGRKTSSSR
jgi:hypothetical protein